MATTTEKTVSGKLTLTLPKEIIDDLKRIASFNKTDPERLLYAYVIDGIANNSRDARRKKFTDKANEKLGKNNIPPKSVEDIFENLVY